MKTKPNGLFSTWRPDEVAECLEGVTADLYQALWQMVGKYKGKSPEEAEEPTPGVDNLAKWWGDLTTEQQAKLNELAEAQNKKFEEWAAA